MQQSKNPYKLHTHIDKIGITTPKSDSLKNIYNLNINNNIYEKKKTHVSPNKNDYKNFNTSF